MSEDQINESFQQEFLTLLQVHRGHFWLESGHHGNLWLDLDQLFLHPKEIQPFVAELAHKISAFDIEAVCGPMVAALWLRKTLRLNWE